MDDEEEFRRNREETCRTHCCVLHGCKYGDKDCPVVKRRLKQAYTCEYCEMDGLTDIPNPDDPDYDLLKMTERELRAEAARLRHLLRRKHQ